MPTQVPSASALREARRHFALYDEINEVVFFTNSKRRQDERSVPLHTQLPHLPHRRGAVNRDDAEVVVTQLEEALAIILDDYVAKLEQAKQFEKAVGDMFDSQHSTPYGQE